MGYRLTLLLFFLGLLAQSLGCNESVGPTDPLQHFIYFGLERDRISDSTFLAIPSVAGAQLKYTWRELEPEEGQYDFESIRTALAFLDRAGMRLFIQLQDVSFSDEIVNVPDYLLDDPVYGGGVAQKYHFEDDNESSPVSAGWVARRWDPAVRHRFSALFQAIAGEFDGRIAGINLAETSSGFGPNKAYHPVGYSYESYFEGILELMSLARRAFQESDVIIYANFMPGEEVPSDDQGFLRGVYEHADWIGVGVGGPDLLPHQWFQRQNSLPLWFQQALAAVGSS